MFLFLNHLFQPLSYVLPWSPCDSTIVHSIAYNITWLRYLKIVRSSRSDTKGQKVSFRFPKIPFKIDCVRLTKLVMSLILGQI